MELETGAAAVAVELPLHHVVKLVEHGAGEPQLGATSLEATLPVLIRLAAEVVAEVHEVAELQLTTDAQAEIAARGREEELLAIVTGGAAGLEEAGPRVGVGEHLGDDGAHLIG